MLRNGNECGKNLGNETVKATIPSTDHNRSKRTGECATFVLFGQRDNKLYKMYTRN